MKKKELLEEFTTENFSLKELRELQGKIDLEIKFLDWQNKFIEDCQKEENRVNILQCCKRAGMYFIVSYMISRVLKDEVSETKKDILIVVGTKFRMKEIASYIEKFNYSLNTDNSLNERLLYADFKEFESLSKHGNNNISHVFIFDFDYRFNCTYIEKLKKFADLKKSYICGNHIPKELYLHGVKDSDFYIQGFNSTTVNYKQVPWLASKLEQTVGTQYYESHLINRIGLKKFKEDYLCEFVEEVE